MLKEGVFDQHSMHECRQQICGEDLNRSYDFLPTLIKKNYKAQIIFNFSYTVLMVYKYDWVRYALSKQFDFLKCE